MKNWLKKSFVSKPRLHNSYPLRPRLTLSRTAPSQTYRRDHANTDEQFSSPLFLPRCTRAAHFDPGGEDLSLALADAVDCAPRAGIIAVRACAESNDPEKRAAALRSLFTMALRHTPIASDILMPLLTDDDEKVAALADTVAQYLDGMPINGVMGDS